MADAGAQWERRKLGQRPDIPPGRDDPRQGALDPDPRFMVSTRTESQPLAAWLTGPGGK